MEKFETRETRQRRGGEDKWQEFETLSSQNMTLKRGKHRTYHRYAFTEYGMLLHGDLALRDELCQRRRGGDCVGPE